jgi:hypothetical protein
MPLANTVEEAALLGTEQSSTPGAIDCTSLPMQLLEG